MTRIRFEQRPLIDKSAHFRYVYGCVYAGKEDMVYETIKNDLTPFRDEIDSGLGTINYLDRQALICPKSSGINVFMTAVAMELDLETEMLRYIYKCGKVDLGTESLCEERSTPKHQTKDFFLLNLEYLGIQCRPDEGLTKFQLRVEHEPGLLLWYEYTCCRQGYGFLGRPSPRNSIFHFQDLAEKNLSELRQLIEQKRDVLIEQNSLRLCKSKVDLLVDQYNSKQ